MAHMGEKGCEGEDRSMAEVAPFRVPIPQLLWDSCDGMMVIDDQRRVLAMNPAMERFTGQRAEGVVGRQSCGGMLACQSFNGCALAEHPGKCPGLKAMRRFKPIGAAEYTVHDAAGRRTIVSTSYTPIRSAAKEPVLALMILRDVSRQRRWERWMAQQAWTDPLTKLPNRLRFLEALRVELKRAARHRRPLTVAMADLDGFKRYNDTLGHLAGDALLQRLAMLLQPLLRPAEVLARYGGDEFVLCLPETDAAGAAAMAERLRKMVAEFPFPHPPITLSIGLATFPKDGQRAEELLAHADRRLYDAKRCGRNRVAGADGVEETSQPEPADFFTPG